MEIDTIGGRPTFLVSVSGDCCYSEVVGGEVMELDAGAKARIDIAHQVKQTVL